MVELTLEDKFGPTRIGEDYGIGVLVEGGIYASIAAAVGLWGRDAFNQVAEVATTNLEHLTSGIVGETGASYSLFAFQNPIVPFFAFAAGVGHALAEPYSKEKIIPGVALAATLAYSLYQTLDKAYQGMSVGAYLVEVMAGNAVFGASVFLQAAIPVLAVFGVGYAVGKFSRWLTKKGKRVTKREKKK